MRRKSKHGILNVNIILSSSTSRGNKNPNRDVHKKATFVDDRGFPDKCVLNATSVGFGKFTKAHSLQQFGELSEMMSFWFAEAFHNQSIQTITNADLQC